MHTYKIVAGVTLDTGSEDWETTIQANSFNIRGTGGCSIKIYGPDTPSPAPTPGDRVQ